MDNKKELEKQLSKNYMPIIYKNIKKFRKASGYELKDVAEILDIIAE
ncbi:MAG: hypothetical protein HFJ50_05000 [Clostridia bacterium]|jgi:hypothetical protein|nr:hypothetical protein [Clostridia bacterium]